MRLPRYGYADAVVCGCTARIGAELCPLPHKPASTMCAISRSRRATEWFWRGIGLRCSPPARSIQSARSRRNSPSLIYSPVPIVSAWSSSARIRLMTRAHRPGVCESLRRTRSTSSRRRCSIATSGVAPKAMRWRNLCCGVSCFKCCPSSEFVSGGRRRGVQQS